MEQAEAKEFGVVGLGRMGGGLALQALEKGIKVVGFQVDCSLVSYIFWLTCFLFSIIHTCLEGISMVPVHILSKHVGVGFASALQPCEGIRTLNCRTLFQKNIPC